VKSEDGYENVAVGAALKKFNSIPLSKQDILVDLFVQLLSTDEARGHDVSLFVRSWNAR
jgi:hypothetical protein